MEQRNMMEQQQQLMHAQYMATMASMGIDPAVVALGMRY